MFDICNRMSGFDGWEESAEILKKLRREADERKREQRWLNGGATLDEMEEFYLEQRGKFSQAYFSGMDFYVGDSFKNWYLGQKKIGDKCLDKKRENDETAVALFFGSIICEIMKQKNVK